MTARPSLIVEEGADRVVWRLNRPEVRNAIDRGLVAAGRLGRETGRGFHPW